jgi:urease accessory protein
MVSLVLAVAAGFFHGYAYGEAVIGAEATPLAAYLVGLALVQSMLMMAVYFSTRLFAATNGAPKHLFSVTRAAAVVLGAASVWSLGAGHLLS